MPDDVKPAQPDQGEPNIPRLTEIKGYTDDERFDSVKFNHWEDIGFQRPLGNFLYGYMITIATTIIGIVLVSFVYQFLWPYPQIQGYNGIAGGVFAIVYQLFDVGTAFGIVRFIAEWRVKNPKRMLEYVRFYIWYQMFTGIVQILIISVVILNVFRFNQFAYLSWVFLIILQKQWPAMLGMFKSVLEGLQLYNKTQILGLVSGQVFQNLTNIIFIIIGRYLGSMNPAVGELMGMVFGAAIGSYVDDFFAMWLSVHYFNRAMKPFGVTARDCMRIDFSKEIVKECLWFGLQVSIVPLINTATSTTMLLMYIERMPQYSTWIVLCGLAGGVSGIVDMGSFNLTAAIAESYMNGKKELARFYVETTFKWNGFLMCFLTLTLISVMPMLMTEIIKLPGLENYLLAVPFLVPTLIHKLFMPWISIPDTVLIGTLHINFYTINRVVEEVNQVVFVWLYLYVFNLNVTFGIGGIVYILAFEHFWPRIIKMIACWVFINKRVMKVRINWMQTFVIPLVSSIPVLAAGILYYTFAFQPLKELFDFLDEYAVVGPAAIFVLIGLLVFPLFVFLPLTGYLGGWDDFQLLTFRKAVDLSGPTKPVAMLMYKSIMFGAKRSKYHNRFKIDWSGASKEIEELMTMKENQTAVKYEKPVAATAPWLDRLLRRRKHEEKAGGK
ncbi:MAG: hypothetical protein JW839_20325 [Candidatus Lokiarchaeota archaeon]|nr:hypothetical protein [Candidatus Lokiarchaeota archaeon]